MQRPLYLKTISACIAQDEAVIADTGTHDITLATDTLMLSITVFDFGVYMKAGATASSSDYDLYLLPGHHELAVGAGVTVISYCADANGNNSTVITIERKSI
jgi:hypothetical protein